MRSTRSSSLILAFSSVILAACHSASPIELYAGTLQAINAAEWKKADSLAEELLRTDPEPGDHLLLAMVRAGEGKTDAAFDELTIAIDQRGNDPGAGEWPAMLRGDSIWDSLRSDPRFEPLVAKAEAMRWTPDELTFDTSSAKEAIRIVASPPGNDYLTTIRTRYGLDTIVAGASSDLERVQRICHWVHGRCGHESWPSDVPVDPLGLLDAAAGGAQFRCVEFGVVAAGCLSAVGIPGRVVGGQSRDVETRRVGAGHVFAEAWLADRGRWVFVDAQMDLVGVAADGLPLNAIEFRNALASRTPPAEYPIVLSMCMYYFRYGTDLRYPLDARHGESVVVAPLGAPLPRRFQREPMPAPDVFTHRPADVYGPPTIGP